MTKAVPFYI